MKQQSFLFGEEEPEQKVSEAPKAADIRDTLPPIEDEKEDTSPPEPRVLSVFEAVTQIKRSLERQFNEIWIQGEISNLRAAPSGHAYLTLKDSSAQISAVCFRPVYGRLKFDPSDGLEVIARGKISVYANRGQMQFIIERIEPVGHGALQLAFEQLKEKLNKEGLFDPSLKKPLPQLPSRVGVVTSPTGAAIQDILRVLKRRNDRIDILIYPTRVQGETAAREIARGIKELNRHGGLDVIIIGRGGGSLEDLWPFNEEIVARAIHASVIPVISAVGHEIDFTISDFTADLRAPTPSAAAEMVAGARTELVGKLEQLASRLIRGVKFMIQCKNDLYKTLVSSRGFLDAESRLNLMTQRLDELVLRMNATSLQMVTPLQSELKQLEKSLPSALEHYMVRVSADWKNLDSKLNAFSPHSVLERGYAIVSSKTSNEVIRDPSQVDKGDLVTVNVAKGSFAARRE